MILQSFGQDDEGCGAIGGQWLLTAVVLTVCLESSGKSHYDLFGNCVLGAGLAVLNVAILFGITMLISSKTDISPNLFTVLLGLFVANLATLLVGNLFVDFEFKGFGDVVVGVIGLVVVTGLAQSFLKMITKGPFG